MTDWDRVPTFGARTPDVARSIRPSAYAIIRGSPGRIALVRTSLGFFLPGGGSYETEAPEMTVVRETREECGLTVRVGVWRGTEIEHVFAAAEQTHFEKRCTFCDATLVHSAEEPNEIHHSLEWR